MKETNQSLKKSLIMRTVTQQEFLTLSKEEKLNKDLVITITENEIERTNMNYYNPKTDLNDLNLIAIKEGLLSIAKLYMMPNDNKLYYLDNDYIPTKTRMIVI